MRSNKLLAGIFVALLLVSYPTTYIAFATGLPPPSLMVVPRPNGDSPGFYLQWTAVPGATGYDVFRDGIYWNSTGANEPFFWNYYEVNAGRIYTYAVRAKDPGGPGPISNPVTVAAQPVGGDVHAQPQPYQPPPAVPPPNVPPQAPFPSTPPPPGTIVTGTAPSGMIASNPTSQRTAVVAGAGNDGLRLRLEPSLSASVITRLQDGTNLTVLDGPLWADGYQWYRVALVPYEPGWCAGDWLTFTEVSPAPEQAGEAVIARLDQEFGRVSVEGFSGTMPIWIPGFSGNSNADKSSPGWETVKTYWAKNEHFAWDVFWYSFIANWNESQAYTARQAAGYAVAGSVATATKALGDALTGIKVRVTVQAKIDSPDERRAVIEIGDGRWTSFCLRSAGTIISVGFASMSGPWLTLDEGHKDDTYYAYVGHEENSAFHLRSIVLAGDELWDPHESVRGALLSWKGSLSADDAKDLESLLELVGVRIVTR